MFVLNILFVFFCATSIQGAKNNLCDFKDEQCTTRSVANYFDQGVSGMAGNWETSDPLRRKLIIGETKGLSAKYTNSVLTGLKQCFVNLFRFNEETSTLDYIMECPQLIVQSQYEFNGFIRDIFVAGKGMKKITRDNYIIRFNSDYELYTGYDGKTHLRINSFRVYFVVKGNIKYEMTGLYYGNKRKADALLDYANKNWNKEELVDNRVMMTKFMEKFIDNTNQFLELYALEDFLTY